MEKSRDGTHGFETRPPVKRFGCVSVCSIACFRLSNFLLLLLDPPISGEIISRRCGWGFHIFRGERGFFSVNKFDEVFDPVFINNFGIERIKWNTVRRIFISSSIFILVIFGRIDCGFLL